MLKAGSILFLPQAVLPDLGFSMSPQYLSESPVGQTCHNLLHVAVAAGFLKCSTFLCFYCFFYIFILHRFKVCPSLMSSPFLYICSENLTFSELKTVLCFGVRWGMSGLQYIIKKSYLYGQTFRPILVVALNSNGKWIYV